MASSLQKYMAFLTAVKYGSFTKAAEVLKYSQSGVSRMIQDLEQEWNVVLLERGKNGVKLTSDGIRLLPYIKNICSDCRKLEAEVEDLNGLQSGILRIGTFSSVASHWLPHIVEIFQRDYPNIDYEFLMGDYEEIENWILEGRVDCGFLRLPADKELETFLLEEDELLVVMPVNHPLACHKAVPVKALGEYPFLMLEKDDNTEISKIFARNGIFPNIHITTWDDYAIMAMVEKGFGISILPRLILHRVPYRIAVKSMERPFYRQIGFAIREQKTSSLAVKRFMEYIKYRKGSDRS